MKKAVYCISIILAAFLICACANRPVEDSVAKKVSEFASSLNSDFQEAWEDIPEAVAPFCNSDAHDLIIVYDVGTETEITAEDAANDDNVNYPYFEKLVEFTGDDSVRLLIQYVANDKILRTHTIDKDYKPSAAGIEIIDPDGKTANALSPDLVKYYNDNLNRISEDYEALFEGAYLRNCYIDNLCLVLEYNCSIDITPEQAAESFEENATKFDTLVNEIAAITNIPSSGLIIRCDGINGENLLNYYWLSSHDADTDNEQHSEVNPDLYKFYLDNCDKLAEEYKDLFEGAVGPNCYIEYSSIVLEYRYSSDITRWQFFDIIAEKSQRLNPVANELFKAVPGEYTELIIRCIDANGEKLLDYPVGAA